MKRKLKLAAIALILCFADRAVAQQKVDPGDLPDFFAGTWTVEGRENSFRETCKWLSPNSFLICNGTDMEDGKAANWITLLGYSHAEKMYNFTAFDGGGGKASFSGWIRGEHWIFTSQQFIHGEASRLQVTIKPTPDGYILQEEESVNGGPWKITMTEKHLRVSENSK
ncbi:MAG: hypothetical protein EON58_07350 [Alphaproteobacteria bacterium]|nr:MAG: hypothetical protein EON58_07350 [Alphaproteobacteria bacterium]